MKKYRILFIEDDLDSAEFVCEYLRSNNYLVTHTDTITTGISYLHNSNYDILLLDLNLPDAFGLDIFNKVDIKIMPSVIVLSAYSNIETKLKAFDFGVDDYMCKPYNLDELNARIKKIVIPKSVDIKKSSNNKFYIKDNKIFFKDKILLLTKMEYKILEILINNKNLIVLRDNLLTTFQLSANSRSIDYHIKNLRKKINDNEKEPTYLITQYGVGYKLIF